MKTSLAAIALLITFGSAQPLLAKDKDLEEQLEPGMISIVVSMELQNDWTTRTRPGGGDRFNLSTKIEPEMTYQATEEVSFVMGVTLEQVATPDRGQDEAFEKHGLYVKTLTANYKNGPVAVYGGKFTPNFGRAWETGPGIYGNRFAKDYEFAERWGAGDGVTFEETPVGDLGVSASFFMVDRKALSDSWITRRGRTKEADGGSGNTDGPRSFAVALDGSNLPVLVSLEYHLGYTQQAKGRGDIGTMRGVVASTQLTLPVVGELEATPLLEWAGFENFNGERGADRSLWTAALQLDHGPWQWVVAYAKRSLSSSTGDNNDRSLQLSTGFTFGNGLLGELSWWRVEQDGEAADIIGMRLSYEFGKEFRLY